jgi:hypothetical protein
MPEGFFERSISITPETILVQEKSIWCEMFQHSATKMILEFQNGFWCKKNESFVESIRRGLISRG